MKLKTTTDVPNWKPLTVEITLETREELQQIVRDLGKGEYTLTNTLYKYLHTILHA